MSSDFERFVEWAEFLGIDGRDAFDLAADRLEHFGIEGCSCGDDSMEYLNTGDTYSETIVLTSDGELLCTTWGDWYENAEREYCEENAVIRCGYCGEFTDDSYYGDNSEEDDLLAERDEYADLEDWQAVDEIDARLAELRRDDCDRDWHDVVCQSCGNHVGG